MSTEPLLPKSETDSDYDGATNAVYHSINADPRLPSVHTASSVRHRNGGPLETQVYARRWYILLLFSFMAGTQGCVWNTFGPISSTAKEAFGWDDGDIGLLTNWGPISFVLCAGPFIWALERKGLRVACLWAVAMVAGGTLVRIITMEPPTVKYTMNIGQALNGAAGPIAMAGPPTISAVWFPPHQRTRATAVGSFFGMMGTAAGFLIGPNLVPDVPLNATNEMHSHWSNGTKMSSTSKAERIAKERKAIHRLIYIECGWACLIFLLIILYFPKKPPTPPSTSAALQRQDFVAGLKNIFWCPQFWIISAVYAIPSGVLNCWSGVIDVILSPYGIGETEAGWIGFVACCGGSVMSILFATLADYLKRVMKWFVLLFYCVGTVAFLVFALSAQGVIHPSTALLWSSVVVGTTALYAATPLLFELACEISYPTGEGTANGVLTLLNNAAGGVFLLIMLDPHIGKLWMNWVLVAASGVCIPVLLFLKEHYNRLDLDERNPALDVDYTVTDPLDQPVSS